MRKSIIFLLALGLLFVNVGCEKQKCRNSSIVTEKPHQNITTFKLIYNREWLENDLSKLGLKDFTIGQRVSGCFTAQRLTWVPHMGGVQAYLLIGKLFWSDLIEKTNFITHTIYYDVYTICKLFNTICVAF